MWASEARAHSQRTTDAASPTRWIACCPSLLVSQAQSSLKRWPTASSWRINKIRSVQCTSQTWLVSWLGTGRLAPGAKHRGQAGALEWLEERAEFPLVRGLFGEILRGSRLIERANQRRATTDATRQPPTSPPGSQLEPVWRPDPVFDSGPPWPVPSLETSS